MNKTNIDNFINELIEKYRSINESGCQLALLRLGQPQYDHDKKKLELEIEQLKERAKKVLE